MKNRILGRNKTTKQRVSKENPWQKQHRRKPYQRQPGRPSGLWPCRAPTGRDRQTDSPLHQGSHADSPNKKGSWSGRWQVLVSPATLAGNLGWRRRLPPQGSSWHRPPSRVVCSLNLILRKKKFSRQRIKGFSFGSKTRLQHHFMYKILAVRPSKGSKLPFFIL